MYGDEGLETLVGKTVSEVWWSEDRVTFVTDQGNLSYVVEGDCCSHSYFFDLYGLDKLTAGPVVSTNSIDLQDGDVEEDSYECIQCYGFQIVTEHPVWGEVTTALSFRNSSNGYYGGWLYRDKGFDGIVSDQVRLTGDKIG